MWTNWIQQNGSNWTNINGSNWTTKSKIYRTQSCDIQISNTNGYCLWKIKSNQNIYQNSVIILSNCTYHKNCLNAYYK